VDRPYAEVESDGLAVVRRIERTHPYTRSSVSAPPS